MKKKRINHVETVKYNYINYDKKRTENKFLQGF